MVTGNVGKWLFALLLGIMVIIGGCSDSGDSTGGVYSGAYRLTSVTFMDPAGTDDPSDDTVTTGTISFPTGESNVGQFDVEVQRDENRDGDYDDQGESWVEKYGFETDELVHSVNKYEKLQGDGFYDDKTVSTAFVNNEYNYVERYTHFDDDGDGNFGETGEGESPDVRRTRTYSGSRALSELFTYKSGDGSFVPWREDSFDYDADGNLIKSTTVWDTNSDGQITDGDYVVEMQEYSYENGRLTGIYTESYSESDGTLSTTGVGVVEYDARGLVEYEYINFGGEDPWAAYFEWEEGECPVRGEQAISSVRTDGFFCFSPGFGGSGAP